MSILDYFKTKPKETDKLVESKNVENEEISKQLKQIEAKLKDEESFSIYCEHGDVPPVRVCSQGILFCQFFLSLFSGMLFNPIVNCVFLQGIQSHAF